MPMDYSLWDVYYDERERLGRPTEAMARLGQALEQRSTHNDEMLVLVLLTFYGLGCWYTGKYGEAVACQQEALHLSQRLDRPWFIA